MKAKRKRPDPYDGNIQATRLRIVAVENLRDGAWAEAWGDLGDAYRQAQHLAHVGARCAVDAFADLYVQGKEHRGRGGAAITNHEVTAISKPMYGAMARAAKKHERALTAGHVAMLAQDLFAKEFSDGAGKKKLSDIIHGKRGFPVPSRLGLPMRPADWWMEWVDREIRRGDNAITLRCPVIYCTSLFAGGGRIRLVCAPLRGRGSSSKNAIVDAMAAIPRGQKTIANGHKRCVVTIKRVKKPQDAWARWMAVVAYGTPKTAGPVDSDVAVVAHRGVAHALMIAIVTRDDIQFHPWFGHEVVDAKAQFRARKQRYQVDAATPRGNGRGRRHRAMKLRQLGDKEQRVTATAMWCAARKLEEVAKESGATIALIESMGTFRCDVKDDRDRAIPSYIRDWPYAALKTKCLDVLRRRLGLAPENIREVSPSYISQTCPACEHVDEDNIARLPRVNASEQWRGGTFRCVVCRFTRDLDEVAIMNMVIRSDIPWGADAVAAHIAAIKKWKSERNDWIEEALSQEQPSL